MDEKLRLFMVALLVAYLAWSAEAAQKLTSERLCRQCWKCESTKCPDTKPYPLMVAFDHTLIAGALQSDFIDPNDSGVYSVPNVRGGESNQNNAYFGWELILGACDDKNYRRFSNYMDKCSRGKTYLTVNKQGEVSLRTLQSLESSVEADWKSVNPPNMYYRRGFRLFQSRSTRKCLTIDGGQTEENSKRKVGVADCKFDGTNKLQLFNLQFKYRNAFCCCNVHNR